jgi:hypothetical protein
MDALRAFLELSRLESKKIRLQALRLVDALESEALGAFKIARRLELKLRNDPVTLRSYGRAEIVERLRDKFATSHVDSRKSTRSSRSSIHGRGTGIGRVPCSWTARRR